MKTSHRHKKHLGQNFLADPRARERVVDACCLGPEDTVLEIGPGNGAITGLLAQRAGRLVCVEKDKDLIAGLREEFSAPHVEVIHADVLGWDMAGLPAGTKVAGNIPYNISTPIIEKLIACRGRISTAVLTVQLEFGRRLAAKPGGKDYGALSCFVQYHAAVEVLFILKRTCFYPAPKVDSCCVAMDFGRPFPQRAKDEGLFFKVVQAAFGQRRKMLANALSGFGKVRVEAILQELGISANARAEELNLHNFVDISDRIR